MQIAENGYWGMWCFNRLSDEQQRFLVVKGYLPFGWVPEGTKCSSPAQLEITCMDDETPGPRFYCVPCAIEYLEMEKL